MVSSELTDYLSDGVFCVCGDRGGVGTSTVSMALTDYLIHERSIKVVIMETDQISQDFVSSYRDSVRSGVYNASGDGLIDMTNDLEKINDSSVVVNISTTCMRFKERLTDVFFKGANMLKKNLYVLWVIGPNRSYPRSLTTHSDIMVNFKTGDIFNPITCNSGLHEEFKSLSKDVEALGRRSYVFPPLHQDVAIRRSANRSSIESDVSEFLAGDKQELLLWRSKYNDMFNKLFSDLIC